MKERSGLRKGIKNGIRLIEESAKLVEKIGFLKKPKWLMQAMADKSS